MPLKLSFRILSESDGIIDGPRYTPHSPPPYTTSLKKYAGSFSPEFNVGVYRQGKQVGYVQATVISREGKQNHMQIDRIFVVSELRGIGVPDRIIDFLEFVARKNNMTLIHLPRPSERVRALVERLYRRPFSGTTVPSRSTRLKGKNAYVHVRRFPRGGKK